MRVNKNVAANGVVRPPSGKPSRVLSATGNLTNSSRKPTVAAANSEAPPSSAKKGPDERFDEDEQQLINSSEQKTDTSD